MNASETAPLTGHDGLQEQNAERMTLKVLPGWLVSLVTHLLVLTMLGLFYFDLERREPQRLLTATSANSQQEIYQEKPLFIPPVSPLEAAESFDAEAFDVSAELPTAEIAMEPDWETTPSDAHDVGIGELGDLPRDLAAPLGGASGSGFDQRRRRTVTGSGPGPTNKTEAAVALALQWLAAHQRPNGSWSFDHRHGPCKTNPGQLDDAHNGATGLAILPYLGAGQTHKEGQYQRQVAAGLDYLLRSMKVSGQTGELRDRGNMYSHGICAIALCEAYGMTQDRKLLAPAQAALNYIVYAQDPVGGGWRYQPRQPGDTSVVGWQLMALKSGQLAYLQVPPETIRGTSRFLDAVQVDSGSGYGYTTAGDSAGTTAVGLLCRMYLGWKRDHGAIERGVARLSKLGPSKNNLYYNYYATQVLRHHEGDQWKAWNEVMREQVLATQAKQGAERGSWYVAGDHGSERGGRVYCTALSTMILEVYYRHQPLYGRQATEEEFPLE